MVLAYLSDYTATFPFPWLFRNTIPRLNRGLSALVIYKTLRDIASGSAVANKINIAWRKIIDISAIACSPSSV